MRRPRSGLAARLIATVAGLVIVGMAFVPTGMLALDWLGRGVAGTSVPVGSSAPDSFPAADPIAASRIEAGPVRAGPIEADPDPATQAAALPAATLVPTPRPSVSLIPSAGPFAMDVARRGVFVSEETKVSCASAAIQMVVSLVGPRIDTSVAFQRRITSLAPEFTTSEDSSDGGWGPAGMAAAITHLSGVPYELRIAPSRLAALRLAATAIRRSGRPVVLLVWYGAHAWVMTGFSATRDPRVSTRFTVTAARILDPWFPRVSRIWGPSAGPDASHDQADLMRNYLAWRRPEGLYPGRDGRFLLLVPASSPASRG